MRLTTGKPKSTRYQNLVAMKPETDKLGKAERECIVRAHGIESQFYRIASEESFS